ncbi:N4-gp56 family major capsid protein [Loigolactobacillus backii]|uniref:N4-gp56 family major capsid protein n=1 Tax=Loigolactobacillus backii TaxID=375175 RepID=UPI0022FD5FC9|nr:N4-gp56 family major capsid protein [Loigolactobacillus backii]MDA5386959.1 N4-gp56 family major capsid protein [Loigolactobacillus backii]MDA5389497.1 N4-gp56 family major capsid protein [Loigolactobacillus backii]
MANTAPTKLADLVNPQVLAPIVSYELDKALRFTPLAKVDTTLQGQAGSVITYSAFTYIGDAEDVLEGESIPLDKIGTTTNTATIKKAAKGTSMTDEAVLSGYGDVVGEHTKQLALSLANKIDNDILGVAKTATQKIVFTPTVAGVQAALDIYDDEDDKTVVAILSPKDAAALRADAISKQAGSEVGANQLVSGTYMDVLGVQIVRSKKLAEGEAVFIRVDETKPAIKLIMKRSAQVETDRDILTDSTIMTANEHYGVYIYYDKNLIYSAPKA